MIFFNQYIIHRKQKDKVKGYEVCHFSIGPKFDIIGWRRTLKEAKELIAEHNGQKEHRIVERRKQ